MPRHRKTFWLAIDPETLEPLTYRTEAEAYADWHEFGDAMDFYRIDPDGHHSTLNDDFADQAEDDHVFARAMACHERSFAVGRA